ncbi:unnamed protein product [Thelazia callipaeda]|uniref:BZIP domain-containing protein n=1 Tax=Thelazia callipaeda TaxID=103827 RepID=A0A0N5CK63_THECL|nr:unnamed protein product [Thelazia callipaeda]
MDGLGVESCSNSHSSSLLSGLNLISSVNNAGHRLYESSSSSDTSVSPTPSNSDSNQQRQSIKETNKNDAFEEKCYRSNAAAKKTREKRRISSMIMEQKLLQLTKENNLLRNRLKQHQQQQQQYTSRVMSHDTVIVSASQKKDTVSAIIPAVPPVTIVPSVPASSVDNLSAALTTPSKLPLMFPPHLFAAANSLLVTPSASMPATILAPSAAPATSSLLAPSSDGTSSTVQAATAATAQQFPVLRICTLQAALRQVQQNYCPSSSSTPISSGHSAFQPFHSSRDPTSSTQSYSPDSSTTDATPLDYSMHDTNVLMETPSDSSHILQYRRLERQSDHTAETETEPQASIDSLTSSSSSSSSSSSASDKNRESDGDDKPHSLLGSLLSTKRTSPLVAQSRTDTHSGLNNTPPKDVIRNDLKNCLSSLAVHLSTSVAAGASTTSGVSGTISDTSSPNAGLLSSVVMSIKSADNSKKDSSEGMESLITINPSIVNNDANDSQLLPAAKNSAIVKALRSRPSSKQQYMDRRRRNNEAAKRCRANRRAQFEYRSKRAQQLEAENEELRREMSRLKQELEQLKALHAAKSASVLLN